MDPIVPPAKPLKSYDQRVHFNAKYAPQIVSIDDRYAVVALMDGFVIQTDDPLAFEQIAVVFTDAAAQFRNNQASVAEQVDA